MSYTFEINKYYDLYQNALHWIKSMLLYDKIRFQNNICKEILCALQRSNKSITMNILRQDLYIFTLVGGLK